jgi:hypothetical protein
MIAQEIIDLIGGLLCLLIALALFTIHIVSSPRKKPWIGLPKALRWSLCVTGWLFLVRGVGLSATETPISGQHMPPLGLLTTLSLATTVCGLAVWIVGAHFPGGVWDRFAFAFKRERENPGLIPLVMTPDDVTRAAEAIGIRVMPPPDPPSND